ncbi:DUF378 domain-containing protein [Pediococcus pentosaceus]|uniref:DUF378 domain-containing protein n=1 Tax=Pediococcus pentosaceus TaxID=1255 RepID=A0AB73HEM2_PEDPE|nr:DUF378 domain-containing protein [Pediococcus pentosaceus]MBF7114560.1 DUF378 domain-containing protein [Pediococcus pentosaceus]
MLNRMIFFIDFLLSRIVYVLVGISAIYCLKFFGLISAQPDKKNDNSY